MALKLSVPTMVRFATLDPTHDVIHVGNGLSTLQPLPMVLNFTGPLAGAFHLNHTVCCPVTIGSPGSRGGSWMKRCTDAADPVIGMALAQLSLIWYSSADALLWPPPMTPTRAINAINGISSAPK